MLALYNTSKLKKKGEIIMKKLVIGLTISAAVIGGFVIAQTMTSGSAATQSTESIKLITEKEAKEIALKTVNGTITEIDFDQDDQRPHYEFEIQSNNEEVNIDVDATTGKATITKREVEKDKVANTKPVQTNETASNVQVADDQDDDVKVSETQTTLPNTASTSKEVITKAEAIKIASTVAKGTVTKVELDNDDNDQTKTYELEFKDGNVEYDVEIDAYTGNIIEVNQDLED